MFFLNKLNSNQKSVWHLEFFFYKIYFLFKKKKKIRIRINKMKKKLQAIEKKVKLEIR